MPRLSIDISDEEHRRLKASAALEGKSLKDYVIGRTLADTPETDALIELAQFLKPRIAEADSGTRSKRSIKEIAYAARKSSTG